MKQKYFRGQRVKIDDDLGPHMRHFGGAGREAIIVGSYRDQHGGNDIRSATQYTCALIRENGKIFTTSSWYGEHQLTLVSDNRRGGERLIQEYNER